MQFTLTYQGQLKANGDKQHKHAIRTSFHQQLSVLWRQHPLTGYGARLAATDPAERILRTVGEHAFAPLILENKATVELRLTLLRAERDGAIFTTGGDIDNRLKTLFDALRMPRTCQELPNDWAPPQYDAIGALWHNRCVPGRNPDCGSLPGFCSKTGHAQGNCGFA